MINILTYIALWILSGIIISGAYRWYRWLNWKALGPYLFAVILGPLMIIAILIALRYEE